MKAPEPQTISTFTLVLQVLQVIGPCAVAIYLIRLLGAEKVLILLAGVGIYFVAMSTGLIHVSIGM